MNRLGLIGTFVWDTIYGRDPLTPAVEEWGGVTYTLAGLDAALPDDWQIVPLIKVGSDLAAKAREYCSSLRHMARGCPLVEVPVPNNRVEIRYVSDARRTERLTGGVPPWSWPELQPLLHGLDALYINLLSGWEVDLATAQLIRQHFRGPIYCDLHSLMLAIQPDGLRTPRPLPNVREWCACFDIIQANEDEMALLAPDPMALAATALDAGARCLVVTLGARGAAYFAAPDFERLSDLRRPRALGAPVGPLRTALVPPPMSAPAGGDPTGCGDVWGATYFSRLLAGDKLGDAIVTAHRAAGRNLQHRGATGLAHHLRGELSST
ncbi:MAG: carbohydrate kinase family protein [Gemmatimonadota bacterium]|nr:carbohydrate kinase family protein [Gemmatimonadota bacterium]